MLISNGDGAGVVDDETQGLGRGMYQMDPRIPLLQNRSQPRSSVVGRADAWTLGCQGRDGKVDRYR